MRLSHFRLRTLMIGVAIVGAILGLGVRLHARAEQYRRVAYEHERQVGLMWGCLNDGHPSERESWHESLATKYRYHASHPWLPVQPDPPPPPE
jgi:hypothetical protein